MLGALIGIGIQLGSNLIPQQPEIFWGLIAAMYYRQFDAINAKFTTRRHFYPSLTGASLVSLSCHYCGRFVAVYAVSNSHFDILLMTGLGVLGFLLHMLKLPLPPVILSLILGPLMELNLRRALTLSKGDWTYLFVGGTLKNFQFITESIGQGDWSALSSLPVITVILWLMTIGSLFLPLLLRSSSGQPTEIFVEGEAP